MGNVGYFNFHQGKGLSFMDYSIINVGYWIS